nr:Chain X, peptide inhibitor [synthetic construct]
SSGWMLDPIAGKWSR